mgnify:CR=1 FL=1
MSWLGVWVQYGAVLAGVALVTFAWTVSCLRRDQKARRSE